MSITEKLEKEGLPIFMEFRPPTWGTQAGGERPPKEQRGDTELVLAGMRATHPSSIFTVYSLVSNGRGLFKGALSTKLVLDIGRVSVSSVTGRRCDCWGRAGTKHGLGQKVKDGLTPSTCRGQLKSSFKSSENRPKFMTWGVGHEMMTQEKSGLAWKG